MIELVVSNKLQILYKCFFFSFSLTFLLTKHIILQILSHVTRETTIFSTLTQYVSTRATGLTQPMN